MSGPQSAAEVGGRTHPGVLHFDWSGVPAARGDWSGFRAPRGDWSDVPALRGDWSGVPAPRGDWSGVCALRGDWRFLPLWGRFGPGRGECGR